MAQELLPLRRATRQRFQPITSVSYSAGNQLSVLLPQVGYLAGLVVNFVGTVTTGATTTFNLFGPWNLVNRFQLSTNIGTSMLVDLSGFDAYLAQKWSGPLGGFRPSDAGPGYTTPNADLYAAPTVASTANAWNLLWYIPISANTNQNFEVGLVPLQAPETQVYLNITCGALTDPVAGITATTGTFYVSYLYYEVPPPSYAQLAPGIVIRTVSDVASITAQGENIYTVPRQGQLMALQHAIVLNGALSDGFDYIQMRFNKNDYAMRIRRQEARALERQLYGVQPLTGVVEHLPFFSDYGDVMSGDGMNLIDTQKLTTLESVVDITGTVTGTCQLRSIRRIFATLQPS